MNWIKIADLCFKAFPCTNKYLISGKKCFSYSQLFCICSHSSMMMFSVKL